jgi:hypothetical protein
MSVARTKESLTVDAEDSLLENNTSWLNMNSRMCPVPPQRVLKGLNTSFAGAILRPETNQMTTERKKRRFRRDGFLALPLGALIRLIPNVKLRLIPKPEEEPTFPSDVGSGFELAVDHVRDNLGTFAKLRGGRMRGSSFVRKSRSVAPDPDGPRLV